MNRASAAALVAIAACIALGIGAFYLLRPAPLPSIPNPAAARATTSPAASDADILDTGQHIASANDKPITNDQHNRGQPLVGDLRVLR